MERRHDRRHPRRFRVNFWERGSDTRQVGFTVNISTTGMFLANNRPLPEGTRLRVQVGPEDHNFIVEAVVARSLRVPPHLQSVRPSGMGVHFLGVSKLVAELVPESDPAPPKAGFTHGPSATTEPTHEQPAENDVYHVVFTDKQQLMAALESDIKNGWLYVPTRTPAAVGDFVKVDMAVRGHEKDPIRFEVRVIERFEPSVGPDQQPNLLAGMGVQMSGVEGAVPKIFGLLARFDD